MRHSLVHHVMLLPKTKVMIGLSGNKKYNNDEEKLSCGEVQYEIQPSTSCHALTGDKSDDWLEWKQENTTLMRKKPSCGEVQCKTWPSTSRHALTEDKGDDWLEWKQEIQQ